MTQRTFISRFSPNRTAPEDLEKITVQRQGLIDEVVSLVRESALKKGKHHLLLVGPRGCGKTHLLALVGSRLGKLDELAERLRIAWLNEDETSTSFLDLLVRIYRALAERYPQEFPHADLEDVYGQDPDQARDLLGASLVRRAGRHTILVMLENLDAMFGQMQVGQQKSWRAFVQNHPIFTTVATAQSLVAGVSEHDQPFFGFFDVRHLKPLTVCEATELLGKIAKLAPEDQDLADFLATSRGRARVRAIHHLAGGNHRLHIVLSEVITKESLEQLVGPFEKMVDEQLTPYYQERLRWLAPLQRRIVELLCQRAQPMPVKEIAERLFASHSTITPQLKQLREMGYVISTPRGRESLYELKEPLMRLSLQVKGTPQAQPLGLLVDFLRVWYERGELVERLAPLGEAERGYQYLLAALAKMESGENLRLELLRKGVEDIKPRECTAEQLIELRDLAADSGAIENVARFARACVARRELLDEAIQLLTKAIGSRAGEPDVARLYMIRGDAFVISRRLAEAIRDFTRFIEAPETSGKRRALALARRGAAHCGCGQTGQAIADLETAAAEEAAGPKLRVRARQAIVVLYYVEGEWAKALERLPEVLRHEVEPEDWSIYGRVVLAPIRQIFSNIGTPLVWQARVKELVEVFAEGGRLDDLGIGLVGHLEELGSAHLNKQGLEAWLGQWEAASEGHPEMQLPLRLLRVGIDYISSEPKDETLLLQLPQEERRLLRQALGLPE